MNDWKPRMEKTVRLFAEQLRGIRTGTISIGLIETVRVACRGTWCRSTGWGRPRPRGTASSSRRSIARTCRRSSRP